MLFRHELHAVVDRAQATQLQLDSIHVVVADVLIQSYLQFVKTGEVGEVKVLRLQGSEEALHGRVVKAVAFARHALGDGAQFEMASVLVHSVLPALVGVQDGLVAWPEALECACQHLGHHVE